MSSVFIFSIYFFYIFAENSNIQFTSGLWKYKTPARITFKGWSTDRLSSVVHQNCRKCDILVTVIGNCKLEIGRNNCQGLHSSLDDCMEMRAIGFKQWLLRKQYKIGISYNTLLDKICLSMLEVFVLPTILLSIQI